MTEESLVDLKYARDHLGLALRTFGEKGSMGLVDRAMVLIGNVIDREATPATYSGSDGVERPIPAVDELIASDDSTPED